MQAFWEKKANPPILQVSIANGFIMAPMGIKKESSSVRLCARAKEKEREIE